MEVLIADKYRVGRKIGCGSFGDIYIGSNVYNKIECAIKLESTQAKHSQLQYESKIYKHLKGIEGFPQLHWYGVQGEYNIMVIDLLGPSLEDLFNFCQRKFSIKTLCLIANEMINRIQSFHSKNFIHRDIKPDNFLIGLNTKPQKQNHQEESGQSSSEQRSQGVIEKSDIINIIDYGLAKKFRTKSGQHINFIEKKSLIGTARYASCNAHNGYELSRRDDLESIGYVLVYFAKGCLPWQYVTGQDKEQKFSKIREIKNTIHIEELCEGLPEQFAQYIKYCKSLKFEQEPDYEYLKGLFNQLFQKFYSNNTATLTYDWCDIIKQNSQQQQQKKKQIQEQKILQEKQMNEIIQQNNLLQQEAQIKQRQLQAIIQ